MKKENSSKMTKKFVSVLGFVIFFFLFSFTAKAQVYVDANIALARLDQNAITLNTLLRAPNQSAHSVLILETKLAYNVDLQTSIKGGINVADALESGQVQVTGALSRTPFLASDEQKSIVTEFVTLLSL